jgi:glycosyltransferase involved in cell wall biosynthesis
MLSKAIKNILVVAESIDREDSSGSKANVALIKNLKEAGFKVTVFHYTRKEIQLEGISCHAIKENRKSLLFALSRVERYLRYWFNLKLHKYIEQYFGFSFTLFNDRNSIATTLKKKKDLDPDLVLTLSKGGSFRPHHAMLQIPEWHDRWMAYIHDPYPFASYPRPYDYVQPGHRQKRKFFLKIAARTKFACYPSKLLAEWMESYYPALRGKSVIIPHQIEEEEIESRELPKFFKKDAFTIVHAGALMNARNPLNLVNAFKKFIESNPEAREHSQLLFVGKRSKYSVEFSKIQKELPQLYSTDCYVPFEQVLAMQKNASVNIILEAKGPISPFLPGKFPHCVQAGKPILLLGPYYSECRRLLGEEYSWWSEIDDEERIAEIINELYINWINNEEDFGQNHPIIQAYLSPSYLTKVLGLIN